MASSDNNTQTRRRKGLIRKEDIASVLTRYTAPTTAVRTAEEGLDATVSNAGGQDGKGKSTHWTVEEDNKLIAAVKNFGKRNWADILQADIFKGDWTASQLSQRWGIIRKRIKLEAGGRKPSARQRATNRAVSSALNMPIINSLLAAYAAYVVPNPMVQEAAVAAGARIATPLTAKSLRKAARSKKSPMPGVHYICTGVSSASPTTFPASVPSVFPPPPTPAEKSQVPSASVEAPSAINRPTCQHSKSPQLCSLNEMDTFVPVSVQKQSSLPAVTIAKGFDGTLSEKSQVPSESVEAPLTINRPTCQDSKRPLDNNIQPCSLNGMDTIVPVSVQEQSSPPAVRIAKGFDGTVSNAVVVRPAKRINITVPVSVQKQSSGAGTTAKRLDGTVATTDKGLDGTVENAGGVQPAKRRKRTPWTPEEDDELIASVKKLGERNWANILKEDIFKGDRTASQLSQRWGIIRKKLSNGQDELTLQRLATNRAVTQALSVPVNNNLSAACTINPANLVASAATVSSQQIPLQTMKGTSGVTPKRRSITKTTAPVAPNPVIQTDAIAAGSRTATPSTAVPLLKGYPIQTAVNLSTSWKSSMPGATPPLTLNHSGAQPNVHYICTGLSSASPTTYSTAIPSVSLPPPTPAVKCKVPSVSIVASASTSCGMVAAGKKANRVRSTGVGNTLEKEKAQNSSKEVVKNSCNEEVNSSL